MIDKHYILSNVCVTVCPLKCLPFSRRVCGSQTTATRRTLCPPTARTVCLRAAGIESNPRTQRSASFIHKHRSWLCPVKEQLLTSSTALCVCACGVGGCVCVCTGDEVGPRPHGLSLLQLWLWVLDRQEASPLQVGLYVSKYDNTTTVSTNVVITRRNLTLPSLL